MTNIIAGLQAIIENSEGRLYDHEREYLRTVILHIQGLQAVAGKASGEGSFRETVAGIPRRSDGPISQSQQQNPATALEQRNREIADGRNKR